MSNFSLLFAFALIHHELFCIIPHLEKNRQWGPVTAVASSPDLHDQSICQRPRHSGITACVYWDVWGTITLEVHRWTCLASLKLPSGSVRTCATVENPAHIHTVFVAGNDIRNKFQAVPCKAGLKQQLPSTAHMLTNSCINIRILLKLMVLLIKHGCCIGYPKRMLVFNVLRHGLCS
jgi:hypothetical protein